jgi:hypothetical protein
MKHLLILLFVPYLVYSQVDLPRQHTHAHNDYEHKRPLWDALANGFISVEADVHLVNNQLLVSHNTPNIKSKTLETLYLKPLDSLLKNNRIIYPDYKGAFYLMIDCKSEAEATYLAIRNLLKKYPALLCSPESCRVKIFLSGERAIETIKQEGYKGIALDGRPSDLGKGFSEEMMPIISDNFHNWSSWNGTRAPKPDDLSRIQSLANRVHAEGKKLRLWAIPDNELTWTELLKAGVDFINTDKLEELNKFLSSNKK